MAGWPTDKAIGRAENIVRKAEGYPRDIARDVLSAGGLPPLVSAKQVREILGSRSPNLERVAGLPDPVYTDLPVGKLWLREEIEAFAPEFQSRPHVASRRAASS